MSLMSLINGDCVVRKNSCETGDPTLVLTKETEADSREGTE